MGPALLFLSCSVAEPDSGAVACVSDVPENSPENTVSGYRFPTVDYALPWNGQARSFGLNVWYPTDAPSENSATYIGTFRDDDSRPDSPVATADCLRPLVLYSHGSQGWGGNNSPLLRTFVANGWVAAAPDHSGNTLVDNDEDRPATYSLIRAADVVATLDWLEDLPADDPLAGRIDTSRVVVLGHSYGAQTAWLLSGVGLSQAGADATCADDSCTSEERSAFDAPLADSRIVGVAPMAGSADASLVDDATWGSVTTPVLFMTGSEDTDGAEPFTRAAAADVRWVELAGGCHESFTSTTLPCDTLDKSVATPIVTAYATAFAWWTVLQSDEAQVTGVLDGTAIVSSVATLQTSR